MNDRTITTLEATIDALRATVAAQNLSMASMSSIIKSKDATIEDVFFTRTLQMLEKLRVLASPGGRQ